MSSATQKQSFQWMINVGVAPVDVEWLEQAKRSDIHHHPSTVNRIEKIYTQAISGLLASTAPVEHLIQAQLN